VIAWFQRFAFKFNVLCRYSEAGPLGLERAAADAASKALTQATTGSEASARKFERLMKRLTPARIALGGICDRLAIRVVERGREKLEGGEEERPGNDREEEEDGRVREEGRENVNCNVNNDGGSGRSGSGSGGGSGKKATPPPNLKRSKTSPSPSPQQTTPGWAMTAGGRSGTPSAGAAAASASAAASPHSPTTSTPAAGLRRSKSTSTTTPTLTTKTASSPMTVTISPTRGDDASAAARATTLRLTAIEMRLTAMLDACGGGDSDASPTSAGCGGRRSAAMEHLKALRRQSRSPSPHSPEAGAQGDDTAGKQSGATPSPGAVPAKTRLAPSLRGSTKPSTSASPPLTPRGPPGKTPSSSSAAAAATKKLDSQKYDAKRAPPPPPPPTTTTAAEEDRRPSLEGGSDTVMQGGGAISDISGGGDGGGSGGVDDDDLDLESVDDEVIEYDDDEEIDDSFTYSEMYELEKETRSEFNLRVLSAEPSAIAAPPLGSEVEASFASLTSVDSRLDVVSRVRHGRPRSDAANRATTKEPRAALPVSVQTMLFEGDNKGAVESGGSGSGSGSGGGGGGGSDGGGGGGGRSGGMGRMGGVEEVRRSAEMAAASAASAVRDADERSTRMSATLAAIERASASESGSLLRPSGVVSTVSGLSGRSGVVSTVNGLDDDDSDVLEVMPSPRAGEETSWRQ
jgi:hypothetical protein